MHHIQKKILQNLMHHEVVRFSALRPAKVESNLYSYHLKLLIKDEFIKKLESGGYTLDTKGLMYIDRISEERFVLRQQPKIISILVVENKKGEILLWRRNKQPFINTWSLPSGKTHLDDTSIETAALREAREKLSLRLKKVRHVGDCYIKHTQDNTTISSIFGHVFYAVIGTYEDPQTIWWKKGDILLPGTEEVIKLALRHKKTGHFFEEINTHS